MLWGKKRDKLGVMKYPHQNPSWRNQAITDQCKLKRMTNNLKVCYRPSMTLKGQG